MPRSGSPRAGALRQRVAQEAAKAMAEEGVCDFRIAKRKAANRLGVDPAGQNMPSNREIEEALAAHQRLFGGDDHTSGLRQLREAAVEAMRLFEEWDPRLVGPVLRGTAAPRSPINLHLFSDAPEGIAMFLVGAGIPYEEATRRLKRVDGARADYPVFRFVAGALRIEATVFPAMDIRQAPASPVDGRPIRRANLREVESLLS